MLLAALLGEVIWSLVRGLIILEDFYAGDLIEKVVELNSSLDNQLSATGYTAEIDDIKAELQGNSEMTERLTVAFLAL